MSEFKIYSSSAGSGKTYTLTKTYLLLALRSSNYLSYKKILAITFTNDAAAEMKNRILEALKDFTSDNFDENSRFYGLFTDIKNELKDFSESELISNSKKIFHSILEDYADFNVKTIDSFVNQIVSAFTIDLKLPFNYEIELDSKLVLNEAVNRLFARIGQEDYKDVSNTIMEFALSKLDEGKSWNLLTDELVSFGGSLLNDESAMLFEKNNDLEIHDYLLVKDQIREYLAKIESKIQKITKTVFEAFAQNGLGEEDFTYGKGGVYGFYLKMHEDTNQLFVNNLGLGRVNQALNEDKWTVAKAPQSTINAIDNIKDLLNGAINDLLEIREKESNKFIILKEIRNSIYKIALLKELKNECDLVLEERNQVMISEFNRKILEIVTKEPVPFIYERLGEKFDHILIDEFQDTSDLQFFNLLPLLENSLSKNNFNMIVGDPKQSIYRWRGGKVELMIHLLKNDMEALKQNDFTSEIQEVQLDSLSNFISKSSLTTNFRSKKEIVAFNNSFFEQVILNYAQKYQKLNIVFEDYIQLPKPNAKTGAHIELELIPYEKEEQLSFERIKEIINEQLSLGYSLSDIAILTRKNRYASQIAEYLNSEGFSIVSKDSLLLKNSLPVTVLEAFLELINDPSKSITRYEAIYLYSKFSNGDIPKDGKARLAKKVIENTETQTFFEDLKRLNIDLNYQELICMSTYGVAEHICGKLNLFEYGNESKYLFTFLDILLDYTQKESVSLSDFLNYWKSIKNSKSISSSIQNEAITVTTIHKSKGLEYPIVLLPFANWETNKTKDKWISLENCEWPELSIHSKKIAAAPFNLNKKFLGTPFENFYLQEDEMEFIENLNMFYVALTRPTDKLFILSKLNYNNKFNGVATWINEYLTNKGYDWLSENRIVINQSEESISQKVEDDKNQVYHLDQIKHDSILPKLKVKSNAARLFDLETFEKSIEKGNKIHSTFAKIKTKNDIDDALRLVKIEGIINESETEEIKASILNTISQNEISFLYEEGLIIENEKEILQRGKDILRPDRVVIKDDQVYIMDYKTGLPKKSHETQIKEYGELFRQMSYKNVKLLLVYLDPIQIKAVS